MDTVYIRYFGQVIKFKLESYQGFIEHLVRFRQTEGIKDKHPPGTTAWYENELGIEKIEYPMDGAFRSFTDHRNGGDLKIISADDFEQLRNNRIAKLNKSERKKFVQAEKLAYDYQPMLDHLGLELLAQLDPKRTLELKLPCNDDLDVDLRDMKNLGYRDGDRHTEKMARRIQFWRTYALSMAPDDREVKQQQKLIQRENVLNGKSRDSAPKYNITVALVDAAIKSASKKIKPPTSNSVPLNKTAVFNAVADEVKVLTGAGRSTFSNWIKKNGTRDYIYRNMPDDIRARMK